MKTSAASLAFLFSLCGISCQFLLVRALDPFIQDEVLCQSVTLGVYLLGMGAGAALLSRYSPRFPLRILFRAELALALLAAFLVPLCYAAFLALELFSDSWLLESLGATKLLLLVLFQPFAFALGALSGLEIPLLSQWLESRGEKNTVTFALAFSYFGAIGGAFFVSFLLLPGLELGAAALTVSLLTLLLSSTIPFLPQENRRVARALPAVSAIVCVQLFLGHALPPMEQAMLKTGYLELRLGEYSLQGISQWWHALKGFAPVERHQTRYQTIDLIPDRFLLSDAIRSDFAMYLNFQPQFTRDSAPAYHESMVFGALAIARNTVRKALVLGGGDGLIVRELLRAGVQEVVLVELDPAMLKLALEHPVLRALNRDSLRDKRVRIIADDAFRFARENRETFDGIFADLPFPVSYDLLKLYSVEFYSALHARLTEGGFLVFDAPLRGGQGSRAPKPTPQEIFHATLLAAGWQQLLAFGPMEPFFFASSSPEIASFDYSRLPPGLSGKTLFNLAALPWALKDEADPALVNSALRPRRVRW